MTETKRNGNFDHMADDYDDKAARIWKFHTQVVDMILQRHHQSQATTNTNQTLLEFGCGTGNICLSLCDHFQHVYGIDISSNMLAKAKEKIQSRGLASKATVHVLDLHATPQQLSDIGFPTQYDWIVCCMTLHHIPDPMSRLELLTRCLRDGAGTLVIVEFATTGDHGHHHHHHHGHESHQNKDKPTKPTENDDDDDHYHHPKHEHHSHAHNHHHEHHANKKDETPSANHKHEHSHAHSHGDHKKTATTDDSSSNRKTKLRDRHGIFSDGFNPQSVQKALHTLGLSQFHVAELPPLEGMDKDHPFYGLPIAVMFASK